MKIFIILQLIIFITCSIYSTGASFIECIINPVSINKDDYILCKTKIQKNSMGALRQMPIEYGWIIINQSGEIEYFKEYYFDTDSYELYDLELKHYEYLENNFKKDIDWNNPPIFLLPIIKNYGFKENNAKKYIQNTEIPLFSFLKNNNIDQNYYVQKTLEGHISTENFESVNIVFKYKNIIILRNYNTLQNPKIIGSNFDFYVYISKDWYNYELIDIYGILTTIKVKY